MYQYNAHLIFDEKKLLKEMGECWRVNPERYEELKAKLIANQLRQMANIEAHESKDHIDQLWAGSKHIEENVVEQSESELGA